MSKRFKGGLGRHRGLLPKKVKTTVEPKKVQPGKYVDPALNIAEAHGLPVPARPPSENQRADIRKTPNLAVSIHKIQAEAVTEGERIQQESKDLFKTLARERGINLEELRKIIPQSSSVKPKPPDVDFKFQLDYEEDQEPFLSE